MPLRAEHSVVSVVSYSLHGDKLWVSISFDFNHESFVFLPSKSDRGRQKRQREHTPITQHVHTDHMELRGQLSAIVISLLLCGPRDGTQAW